MPGPRTMTLDPEAGMSSVKSVRERMAKLKAATGKSQPVSKTSAPPPTGVIVQDEVLQKVYQLFTKSDSGVVDVADAGLSEAEFTTTFSISKLQEILAPIGGLDLSRFDPNLAEARGMLIPVELVFKTLDVDGDNRVTPSEFIKLLRSKAPTTYKEVVTDTLLKQLYDLFSEADNGDAGVSDAGLSGAEFGTTITVDKLQDLLKPIGGLRLKKIFPEYSEGDEVSVEKVFAALDKDGNNRITISEFLDLLSGDEVQKVLPPKPAVAPKPTQPAKPQVALKPVGLEVHLQDAVAEQPPSVKPYVAQANDGEDDDNDDFPPEPEEPKSAAETAAAWKATPATTNSNVLVDTVKEESVLRKLYDLFNASDSGAVDVADCGLSEAEFAASVTIDKLQEILAPLGGLDLSRVDPNLTEAQNISIPMDLIFKSLDVNGDHRITASEFVKLLRFKAPETYKAVVVDSLLRNLYDIFSAADTETDAGLSCAEFDTSISIEKLQELLAPIGGLNLSRIVPGYSVDNPLSAADVFKALDTNKDNRVTINEFLDLIRKNNALIDSA